MFKFLRGNRPSAEKSASQEEDGKLLREQVATLEKANRLLDEEAAELKERERELKREADNLSRQKRDLEEHVMQRVGELARANERMMMLAAIVESSDDAIIGKALDGRIISWNGGAERMYGHKADEIIGQPVDLLVPPELREEAMALIDAVRSGKHIREFETVRVRKDGSRITVALTVSPVLDAVDRVVAVSVIERNITEQKRSHEALRKSEERLQLAQSAAHAGAWEWNFTQSIIYGTAEFMQVYGFDPHKEPTYEMWMGRLLPEDREEADHYLRAVIENPPETMDFQLEFRIYHPERGTRWISVSGRVLELLEGKASRMVGMAIDVTDRKRVQQEMQEMTQMLLRSEGRLGFMINQLLVGVAQTDLNGRFTFVNKRYSQMVGRKPEELYGMQMQEITHPDDLTWNLPLIENLKKKGESFTIQKRYLRPDGGVVWVKINVSLMPKEDGSPEGILAVTQDITEQINAEQALKESEFRFRQLAESAVVGVAETVDAIRPTFVNDAFCRMLGYSCDELMRPGFDWRQVTPPEYVATAAKTLATLRRGETVEPYEREYIHRDGHRVPALVGMSRLEDPKNPRIAIFIVDLSRLKESEQARRESERRLRLAQECANIGMWDNDLVTGKLTYSENVHDLMGIPRDMEITTEAWLNQLVPEDTERLQKEFSEALAEEKELSMEYRVRHPRRGVRWIHAAGRSFRNEEGSAIRAIGVIMDITDRKVAEDRAREQETLFRQVMDNVRSAFLVADSNFSEVHYVNPAHEKTFGISNTELMANPNAWYRVIHSDDLHFVRYTHESMNGGELNFRYRIVKPDGSIRWIQDRTFPVRDAYGKVVRVGSMAEDITGRRQFEESLRQSEEQLRLALTAAHLGEWRWNLREETVVLSREARKIFSMAERSESLHFAEFLERVDPQDREEVQRKLLDSIDRGVNYDQVYRISLPDGTKRWLSSHGHAQYHRKGSPVRMIGVTRDITEQKKAEEDIRQTSQRVATILEHISDGFVDVDRDLRFTYVNRRATEMLGMPKEAMLGKSIPEIFPHVLESDTWLSCEELIKNAKPWSGERYSDYFGIWLEVRCYPGTNGVSIFFSDITDRKQAMEAMESREQHFRMLADSVPVLISAANNHGLVTYVNKAWTEFTGRSTMEEIGEGWLTTIHPDDIDDFVRMYLEAVRGGSHLMAEIRLRDAEGEYRWFLARGVPRQSGDALEERFLVSCVDITERKKAEEQIKRVNKDLESFAYIVSHDLKAPLRGIGGYAGMLESGQGERLDDEAKRQLRNVIEGAEQMTALINDLLAFSKVQRTESAILKVSLSKIIAKAKQGLKRDIEESGAEIVHGDLPSVSGDAVLLAQLFQNLIGNSIKFSGKDAPRIEITAEEQKGEWLISVKDNGIGIEPRYHGRIFDVFRRLHGTSKYSGTGIGLAICKKIVERHNGRIWIDSEKGRGATFYITLPIRKGIA